MAKRNTTKQRQETPADVRRALAVLSLYDDMPAGSVSRETARAFAQRAAEYDATVETLIHATLGPHPLDDQRTGITPEQRTAGEQISQAFQIITTGANPRGADYSGMPRGGSGGGERESEWIVRLQRDYSKWCDRCHRDGIRRSLILAFCVDGVSARRLDRAAGWRNGRAMQIIRSGLDAFAEIRGIKEPVASVSRHRFLGEIRDIPDNRNAT